ncbi:gene transfer agent family protein [Rhizobium sp. DKSPLA3]|uniref:Gene transfer agent family protein n=1 Tax=Rhizobium quercicola TaxID=2901226 RepID=A0A9X1NU14_9HYPH|nr:gene transfer agent family protein [Rhizobium quercicola]MCD7110438.1 gene transfer agent family protein [Rhizobium quercicola]
MSEALKIYFGDGDHAFVLTPELVVELERQAGVGIGLLSKRFFSGDFAYSEVIEIIRLSLIGGGMDPKEAAAMIKAYTPAMPVSKLYALALSPVQSLMFGEADLQDLAKTTPRRRKSK